MFVDWQCSFSRRAWGTMEQVLQHYGNRVYFVFHVTVLWLFRQSANLAVAAEIIAEYGLQNPSTGMLLMALPLFRLIEYWKLVTAMYANQPAYYNAQFYNKTEADEYKMLAAFALKYGVDNATFYSSLSPV